MFRDIRDMIASRLVGLARHVSSDIGWSQLADTVGAPGIHAGLQRLKRRGVTLNSVVDVGACVGD